MIDTSIWSLGFRRRVKDMNDGERRARYAWEKLLNAGEAEIIGPIRQEVLSGIASREMFAVVRDQLATVDDLAFTTDSFVRAAEFFNLCKAAGVAPGMVDMAICAAAEAHGVPIFSSDPDFQRYAGCLPITLFEY